MYELKQRQQNLGTRLKDYKKAGEKFVIRVSYLIELSSRDHELFKSSKAEQKRQLINFILSNLRVHEKILQVPGDKTTLNSIFCHEVSTIVVIV